MGRSAVVLCALVAAVGVVLALPTAAGAAVGSGRLCIAKHANYVEDVFVVHYAPGCTGHDAPELDPLSGPVQPGA